MVDDGYESSSLDQRAKSIVAFTDVFLASTPPPADLVTELKTHMTDAQLIELSLGIGLFHGFSKLMISLGLEPEDMETTVLPTPF